MFIGRSVPSSQQLMVSSAVSAFPSATAADPTASNSPDSLSPTRVIGATTEAESQALAIEQMNASLVSQEIDFSQVDLLFIRSRLLSSSGIVAFVKGLCDVSKYEKHTETHFCSRIEL